MNNELIKSVSSPLYGARGWIKLLAVVSLIYGILMAISIFGLIIAWLPIWLGVLLWQSTGALEQAYLAGDTERFIYAQKKLATWFTIMGIMLLLQLLLMMVGMFLGFGAVFSQYMGMG